MANKVGYLPRGYHNVVPYIVCDDVAGLIQFLEATFAAKLDAPPMDGPGGKIVHADVVIGDSHVMIGGANEKHPAIPTSLYVYVEDTDATYKKALAAGGTSLMEPADMFYGDRNSGVKDAWGNTWWIGTHIEDLTNDQIKANAEKFYASAAAK